MKNLLILLVVIPLIASGQDNCTGSINPQYFNSNNIKASFLPRGNKFTSGVGSGFFVPYPNEKLLSTIFASSPWIGGLGNAGNIKGSFEGFPDPIDGDFGVGPLQSIGIQYPDSICNGFDRVWSVYAEDIIRHKEDFEEDFILDDTITSIFSWPGRGNAQFKKYNGFTLPDPGNVGLAPFRDFNSNGIYDPAGGDYPMLCPHCPSDYIPDQMMWMVFNDLHPSDTGLNRRPIRVEIQLTVFAYNCQDNELLNNTIFNRYQIISKATQPLDSAFFGMWTDYDLGCAADDFVGSDSLRRSEFVYNADPVDGDSGNDCTLGSDTYGGNNPPVQSLTYLNLPMHSFIRAPNVTFADPRQYYNLLTGSWQDGTPIRPVGDGYEEDTTLSPTKFLFNGNPLDTSSWSAINVLDESIDEKTISSVYLGRFNPGQIKEVFLAYSYHHDPESDFLGQIKLMQENIDSLRTLDFLSPSPCTPFPVCTDDDCVWPGDFDHNGKVDHEDYLAWSVFNTQTGSTRNGLISWRGHYSDEWETQWEGINAKNGDGNGDGLVDEKDIDINQINHLLTNDDYAPQSFYPAGDDLVLTVRHESTDEIFDIQVRSGRKLENVMGLSFEVEFDTTIYSRKLFHVPFWPDQANALIYRTPNQVKTYNCAFAQKNSTGISIDKDYRLFRTLPDPLALRPGKVAPDSTIIRLRNLKGIDPQGNDLQLGSREVVIYRDNTVSTKHPNTYLTSIFPNPTNGIFHMVTDTETDVQLYSLQGQLLKHFNGSETDGRMDVSDLHPGIYILKILSTGETLKLAVQ